MIKSFLYNSRVRIAAVFVVLLCFGYVLASAQSQQDTYVKVGLYYDRTALSSATLQSEEGFILFREENNELTQLKSLATYTTLALTVENGDVILKDSSGSLLSIDMAADSVLMSAATEEESQIITVNNLEFRDGIIALASSDAALCLVNYVTLEHYLKGVLNAEMSYAYPVEALKAQAISARSFTMDNLGKHSRNGFDLCTDTCCQVYKGVAAEHDETNYACESTAGLVMLYDGEVVAGYYCANSGGYTQNSEDVWVSALGYLRAVKDEFAPVYAWSTSMSFDSLKSKLENAGYSPGSIQSVSVANRNETGSVSELLIIGSNENISLKKETIRSTLGSTVLKSLRFSMGESENPQIISVYEGGGFSIQNSVEVKTVTGPIKILSAGGQTADAAISDLTLFDGVSSVSGAVFEASGTEFTEEEVNSGTIFFSGLGYGHGVGMPQTSARVMANQGYGYEDILNYYYTDITIESLWGLTY